MIEYIYVLKIMKKLSVYNKNGGCIYTNSTESGPNSADAKSTMAQAKPLAGSEK